MHRIHISTAHLRTAYFAATLLLCSAAFSTSLAAHAQAAASDDDKHFVEAALEGGMSEVNISLLEQCMLQYRLYTTQRLNDIGPVGIQVPQFTIVALTCPPKSFVSKFLACF